MNAFEQIVSSLLAAEGYWTVTNLFVMLEPEDKRAIGRPSSPRWELDVVAYKPRLNELLVVECKSYLDSTGVQARSFNVGDAIARGVERYKLFNEEVLRRVVLARLKAQLLEVNMIDEETEPKLGLACGKIADDSDRQALELHFREQNWFLMTDHDIVRRVRDLAPRPYENSALAMVAKLLLRAAPEA